MARTAVPLVGALLCMVVLAAAAAAMRAPAEGRPRPFEHERHEAVPCTACHGTGDRHGVVLVRTALQCAACHHDPAQPRACTVCHAAADLPAPGSVSHSFESSLFGERRIRNLPFGHARHGELSCRSCHVAAVTLAPERSCSSCHVEHHGPAAECAACHQPAGNGVHGAGVHLSCSGAGCHAPGTAPSPTLSRSLCLACHAEQRSHEPGVPCAGCHLLVGGGLP
jgi:hypothetical protein